MITVPGISSSCTVGSWSVSTARSPTYSSLTAPRGFLIYKNKFVLFTIYINYRFMTTTASLLCNDIAGLLNIKKIRRTIERRPKLKFKFRIFHIIFADSSSLTGYFVFHKLRIFLRRKLISSL